MAISYTTTLLIAVLSMMFGSLTTIFFHFPVRRERRTLRQSHLGVLSPAAIRSELRKAQWWACLRRHQRYDVIAIDIRKMHQLNEVLGYDYANRMIQRWLTSTLRADDIAGQWGGDEIVLAPYSGQGDGVVKRLIDAAQNITNTMSEQERNELRIKTGGLVDGFHIAASMVYDTPYLYDAAVSALDDANRLKSGRETGDRATSGAVGTIINKQHTF